MWGEVRRGVLGEDKGKCVGVWGVRRGVEKCFGVWGEVRGRVGSVESVERGVGKCVGVCVGGCREVLGEVWKSVEEM